MSPLMRGRVDFQRYQRGARVIENFVVLLQGGLQKRPGSRYVATVKTPTTAVRLESFIFRSVDALVLQIGHEYIRFCKNSAQVESPPGTPVEVVTPYQAWDVFALRLTQKNDVVYITHQAYAPRKLQRLSDTSWQLTLVSPQPPPTSEAGRLPGAALTLGAVTGSGITCTAASAAFLASDVDREIVAGAGRAVITAFTSPTVVTLDILDAFASTTIASGAWTLTASPMAILMLSRSGPVKALVTLGLRKEQPGAPELVTNGTFPTDLSGWTNHSAPQVASGTHDGLANAAALTDTTADFNALGVLPTQLLHNTTDGSAGEVLTVTTTRITVALAGGTENDFDISDAYTIAQTGSATALNGAAVLYGGTAGAGWIEQGITTVAGQTYQLTFDVAGNNVACQVGSSTKASDLAAEASFPVGAEQSIVFTALGASTYIQLRNNQNTQASVDNVSCKISGIDGWRSDDVGKYVYVHGGLIKITAFISAQEVTGQILELLSTDADAAAGAWTLESDAWNITDGYPAFTRFHGLRLLWFSSPDHPQGIWGSAIDDFENFLRGSTADSAFFYSLAEAQGLLYWAESAEQLIVGAENAPFRVVGEGEGPIVPTSPPLVRPVGTLGSGAVEAVRVGTYVLYTERNGASLQELSFVPATQTADERDMSSLSGHLLDGTKRLVQLAYDQHAQLPIVWGVRSDGTLLGFTYQRVEEVRAWHRHTLGGEGVVESVATIPHPTLNAWQTWLVVRRTIGGSTTRYIEVLADTAVGVDSAVEYSGAAITTLTGLTHLNGQSVRAAGIPATGTHWALFEAQTVSGGQITLPMACTQAFAGLAYEATLQTLSPEIPNAPSIQRERKRWQEAFVALYQTGPGLYVNGQRVETRDSPPLLDDGVPWVTGDYKLPVLGWDTEGLLTFSHGEPGPCTILLTGGALEVGG